MENQISKQFDTETLIKIGKGALIAGTGAVALYLLDWAGKVEVGTWTPLVSAIVPILVNAVKEWLKGSK